MKMKLKKTLRLLFIPGVLLSHIAYAHENDDPILTSLMLDKLEWRDTEYSQQTVLDAQAWIGKDLNKFWLKTEIEKAHSEIEHAEIQALYSHAITPFWDIQMGLRQDLKPTPRRTWGVLGIQGLAPYFFDVDAALFIGEAGRTAARISAEYDLRFTQRLILSPEVDINLYGQNDQEAGTGSGLSDINAGLRLRYEIFREFAPYIGVNWSKKFDKSADFARHKNETIKDTQWVIGLHAWF
jgi:copper resistance protein B